MSEKSLFDGELSSKWTCRRCTYNNFPRAKKCTMCGELKSLNNNLLIINTDSNHGTDERDIYKMSQLIVDTETPEGKNNTNVKSVSNVNTSKWSCNVCTYLNYPRSLKCTQCLTPRKTRSSPSRCSSPSVASSVTNETSSNMRSQIRSQTFDGQSLTTGGSTITADSYNNDKNRSETLAVQCGLKWACPACTYDNWNATKKCIICATMRKVNEKIAERSSVQTPSREPNADRRSKTPSPSPCAAHGTTVVNNTKNNKNKIESGDMTSQNTDPHCYNIDDRCNDLYGMLISNPSRPIAKRAPSDVCRYVASEIKRHITNGLRQRKGDFACYFVSEFVTFALPAEVEDLSSQIQERLYEEILDRDVQKELEEESSIINWSIELTERLGSRLYALWNRSTGDCLLDSVLQSTWGVFDRDNVLRKALGDSLSDATSVLFPRFKEAETLQANLLHFTLDDDQWQEDWAVILSLATQPGQSLEQIHIFTLAHILRRPIIVYSIRIVKSFRGETLGYAGYEGIYLPLLWEPSFCWKSPIALGYTRGHFSALVPMEPDSSDAHIGAGANLRTTDDSELIFLPLVTSELQLLPLHFLRQSEIGREEEIMRQWLDCCVTTGGILVARQKIPKRPLLVAQMMEEWLDFYRNLTPSSLPHNVNNNPVQDFSSDPDSDQE